MSGIFDDEESVFDDDVVDTENQPIHHYSDEDNQTKMVQKKYKRKLVCKITNNGPFVAYSRIDENGKLIQDEKFRRPTQDEIEELQINGRIVKRPSQQRQMQVRGKSEIRNNDEQKKPSKLRMVLALGILSAGVFGGYKYIKKIAKKEEDDIIEQLYNDHKDDVDDDDE